MIQGFKTNKYGHVTIKNVMLENVNSSFNKGTLYNGIEIVTEDCDIIEIPEHHDLDNLSNEDVEKLIDSNKSILN